MEMKQKWKFDNLFSLEFEFGRFKGSLKGVEKPVTLTTRNRSKVTTIVRIKMTILEVLSFRGIELFLFLN